MDDRLIGFVVYYACFLFAISFHEMAHAIVAKWGGDDTAEREGRITMNPLSHIDPVGTVVMPILGFILAPVTAGFHFIIGWARPVPFWALNFRRSDYSAIVALAGPMSNVFLMFAGMWMLVALQLSGEHLSARMLDALRYVLERFVGVNAGLAVFNMLPIPPLDGSHVLWNFWLKHRPRASEIYATITQYSFILLIVAINLPFVRAGMRYAMNLLIEFSLWITTIGLR